MSSYPVNGVTRSALQRGTVVPILARGVQDPEADPTSLTVETTGVILHHFFPLTQRMGIRVVPISRTRGKSGLLDRCGSSRQHLIVSLSQDHKTSSVASTDDLGLGKAWDDEIIGMV